MTYLPDVSPERFPRSVLLMTLRHGSRGGMQMLHYAVVFFIIAIIAAVLGFGGLAAGAAGIAKILFFVFLVLALISLLRRA
jgi:uncharacterized membrane protein YtjA (UPF0391 family)